MDKITRENISKVDPTIDNDIFHVTLSSGEVLKYDQKKDKWDSLIPSKDELVKSFNSRKVK